MVSVTCPWCEDQGLRDLAEVGSPELTCVDCMTSWLMAGPDRVDDLALAA